MLFLQNILQKGGFFTNFKNAKESGLFVIHRINIFFIFIFNQFIISKTNFFHLLTLPWFNFNPPTVFILVKRLKFGFINCCPEQSPYVTILSPLFLFLFFFYKWPFPDLILYYDFFLSMFTNEHVVPGPASKLATCFPVMLGTWWFMTFVLFKQWVRRQQLYSANADLTASFL